MSSQAITITILLLSAVAVLGVAAFAGRSSNRAGTAPPVPDAASGGGPARPARNPNGAERRRSIRVPAAQPVLVRRGGPQAEATRSFLTDLSETGACLAGPSDLQIGDELWITLDLGDDVPVDTRAIVMRETPQGYKGVRFERIDAPAAERVGAYVRSAAIRS